MNHSPCKFKVTYVTSILYGKLFYVSDSTYVKLDLRKNQFYIKIRF